MTSKEIIERLDELGVRVKCTRRNFHRPWRITAIRLYKIGPRRGQIRFMIEINAASKIDSLRAVYKSACTILRRVS